MYDSMYNNSEIISCLFYGLDKIPFEVVTRCPEFWLECFDAFQELPLPSGLMMLRHSIVTLLGPPSLSSAAPRGSSCRASSRIVYFQRGDWSLTGPSAFAFQARFAASRAQMQPNSFGVELLMRLWL